jgi:hypothetical protein
MSDVVLDASFLVKLLVEEPGSKWRSRVRGFELKCAAAAQVASPIHDPADHNLMVARSIQDKPSFDRKRADLRGEIGAPPSDLGKVSDQSALAIDAAQDLICRQRPIASDVFPDIDEVEFGSSCVAQPQGYSPACCRRASAITFSISSSPASPLAMPSS